MQGGALLAVFLPVALFIIMFGVGISLRVCDFVQVVQRPGVIAVGLALQLLLLPLIGLAVVWSLDVPAVLAVGLLILTFAPGGATSNLISHLCRADTALSICLTVLASLIIPFTLPWLTYWSLQHFMGAGVLIELPLLSTVLQLFAVGVLPVALGLWAKQRWGALCQRLARPVKALSLLFMLAVVVLITLNNYGQLVVLLSELGPAVLLLASSAMLLAYGIGRYLLAWSTAVALTLAIETGIQNAGTALMISGAILQNAEMSMSALLYGILMQLPVLLLIIYRNLPLAEPLRELD